MKNFTKLLMKSNIPEPKIAKIRKNGMFYIKNV